MYTKCKSLLKPLEVEDTQSNAHVRIHVESVIDIVCQKYKNSSSGGYNQKVR